MCKHFPVTTFVDCGHQVVHRQNLEKCEAAQKTGRVCSNFRNFTESRRGVCPTCLARQTSTHHRESSQRVPPGERQSDRSRYRSRPKKISLIEFLCFSPGESSGRSHGHHHRHSSGEARGSHGDRSNKKRATDTRQEKVPVLRFFLGI